jgi:large subunit ribosomal protein L24
MQKIRKGDTVVVTTGREKGKRGTVLRILADEKVLIEGVNRMKKHQRPNPVKGQTGGIVDKEMPLHISNVMLVNPATGKGDRVGFKFLEAQGATPARKVRFFKSNGEVVDV